MRKIYYLVMCCLALGFVACNDDDKDNPSNSSSSSDAQSCVENGHEWVDLGLTSGTKWATCNVGATNPQDYGNYYAWGETTTKTTYDWTTYLGGKMSCYEDCGTEKDKLKGVTDIAGTEYDAAKANWGGKWRMPTAAQQKELYDECYWVWTSNYNSTNTAGYIVYKAKTPSDKGERTYVTEHPYSDYSLSDAHIFLPAAGYYFASCSEFAVTNGVYWSSTLGTTSNLGLSQDFTFSADCVNRGGSSRYLGQPVRAVCLVSE